MNGNSVISKKRGLRRRGYPVWLRILKKSKHMRRWLLNNPWIRPISVFNYASILLQKLIRGFIVRRRLRRKGKGKPGAVKKKTKKGTQLENYMNYLDKFRESNKPKPQWLNGGYSAWCVVKIQSVVRMYLCRRKHLQKKRLVNQVAAIILQTFWRNMRLRFNAAPVIKTPKPKKMSTKHHAALKFQLCWRSYCNRRIYKYFRDLVMLKLKGAPADLLRSIIANESDILDRAAGVHVKFRLGGSIFLCAM